MISSFRGVQIGQTDRKTERQKDRQNRGLLYGYIIFMIAYSLLATSCSPECDCCINDHSVSPPARQLAGTNFTAW